MSEIDFDCLVFLGAILLYLVFIIIIISIDNKSDKNKNYK